MRDLIKQVIIDLEGHEHAVLFHDRDHLPVFFEFVSRTPRQQPLSDKEKLVAVHVLKRELVAPDEDFAVDKDRDPDQNGVELYRGRPHADWTRTPNGRIAMFTRPLDLNALLYDLSEDS